MAAASAQSPAGRTSPSPASLLTTVAVKADELLAATRSGRPLEGADGHGLPPVPKIRTHTQIVRLLKDGDLDLDGYLASVRAFRFRTAQQGKFSPTPLRDVLVHAPATGRSPVAELARNPVALKLLLAMHVRPNQVGKFTDPEWAEMLGSANPGAEARKQVQRARERLADLNLTRGRGRQLELAHEAKPGEAYVPPTKEKLAGDTWFRVPWTLTVNGWLAVLGHKAIAALLVLLAHTHSTSKVINDRRLHAQAVADYPSVELGERTRSSTFDLGRQSFYDGVRELNRWGLVYQRTEEHPHLAGGMPRSFYRLHAEALLRTPIHKPAKLKVTPSGSYRDELRSLNWL